MRMAQQASRRWPRALRTCLVALLAGVFLAVGVPESDAHTPHDVIFDVEMSPSFDEDRTAYAIARSYLLKTEDGGASWRRLVRGLDHKSPLSSIGVAASDSRVLYAGTKGDGVYRSEDEGTSWTKVNGNLPGANVLALAVSPHAADTVFVTIVGKGGPVVHRTDDGGRSWSQLPDAGRSRVIAFATDDDQVIFTGDGGGRVRLSSDGGSTWSVVYGGEGSGGIADIAVSPAFSRDRTVYVATREAGALVSTDGGGTFAPLDSRMTGTRLVSVMLSPAFEMDSTVWLSTWGDGVFTSDDAGATWQPRSEGLTTNEQADLLDNPQFGALRTSAGASGGDRTVFLAGFDGLFRASGSNDWESVETQVSSNIVSVAVSPNYRNDQTLAVATYINGALLSRDGGETWRAINAGLATEYEWTRAPDYVARLTGIGFSPSFEEDQAMFAGIRGYVLRSVDSGESWTALTPDGLLAPDEVPADYTLMAFSPRFSDDRTILLGTDGGKVFRSKNAGASFSLVADIDLEITAIAITPGPPGERLVVAGTAAGVYISADEGTSWSRAGGLEVPITSLAISPSFEQDKRVYVGTQNGLFVSDDAAASWSEVMDPVLGPAGVIEAVALSPAFGRDGTGLVSVKGRGLFRTSDRATTFTPVGGDLFERSLVLSTFYHSTTEPIVFSPDYERDRTVFGFAETSLLKSTDGGETWEVTTLPVTMHDTSRDAAEGELLKTAVFGGRARDDDRSFGTPIGRLSVRRVLAALAVAVVVLAAVTLARGVSVGGRRLLASASARVALATLVLFAALLAVAE